MSDESTAVLDPPESALEALAAEPRVVKKGKKRKDDLEEYGVEFDTPFGKLDFELEPRATKEQKDQEKRDKAAAAAAKAADKERKRAEKLAKRGIVAVAEPPRKGGNLLPILLIFALIAGAIILAIWLFGRSADDDEDKIPAEFLNDAPEQEPAQPQGFVAKTQQRVREAVRAGKQASRETQREQQKKFEDLTGKR